MGRAHPTSYNALGQIGTADYGNGSDTVYQYRTDNNRLNSITTDGPSVGLMNISYAYDNAGNITGITDLIDSANSQSFTYDDINRLKTADSSSYTLRDYAYDEIGNITSKAGVSYTYAGSGGPHAVASTSDGKTYTHDSNGNMTSDSNRTVTYDYDNMPDSVTTGGATTTFVYSGGGQRVKKITSSATIIYIGKLYECSGGSCSKFIFAGGTRLAVKTASETYYYHQDHLGSSSVVTDSTGAKVEEVHYYPYGETRVDTGSVSVDHKYTSQELDAETGLYYYGARYYDPVLGRFISPDSIVPDPGDPQSFNRYSYARNNPLIYIDPTGHSWLSKALKKLVDPAIAFVTGTILSGGNPVVGLYAAISTAALNTGEGRQIVRNVADEVFDDILGVNHQKTAYMLSYITMDIGLTWGMTSAHNRYMKAQGGSGGSDPLADVDPNGVEYTNPTGGGIRGCDLQGCGYANAGREGGLYHKGIDIISRPGQDVGAPFGGRAMVSKYKFGGVDIAGKSHYARMLYVQPSQAVANAGLSGLRVRAGQIVGQALNIRGTIYPSNITNHIHFELYGFPWRPINPTPFIFK